MLYLHKQLEHKLRAIDNCIFPIRTVERKVRPILWTVSRIRIQFGQLIRIQAGQNERYKKREK
jgi:hypothetical protein